MREREREREREKERKRERERERERERVCVCVCERERERETSLPSPAAFAPSAACEEKSTERPCQKILKSQRLKFPKVGALVYVHDFHENLKKKSMP